MQPNITYLALWFFGAMNVVLAAIKHDWPLGILGVVMLVAAFVKITMDRRRYHAAMDAEIARHERK